MSQYSIYTKRDEADDVIGTVAQKIENSKQKIEVLL